MVLSCVDTRDILLKAELKRKSKLPFCFNIFSIYDFSLLSFPKKSYTTHTSYKECQTVTSYMSCMQTSIWLAPVVLYTFKG